jgi:hypothetical protein
MAQATVAGVARQVARLRAQLREMHDDKYSLIGAEMEIAERCGWTDPRIWQIDADVRRVGRDCDALAKRIRWLEGLQVAS